MFHFPVATTPKAQLPFVVDTGIYQDDGSFVPTLFVDTNQNYIVFVADADTVYIYGYMLPANEIVYYPDINPFD
jgi:hypothetical protein